MRCKSSILLIFLLLFYSGFSQEIDSAVWAKTQAAAAPLKTVLAKKRVSVALVGGKFLPLVDVMINGKGPYRLLVDAGANITLLQTKVADELRLKNLQPNGRKLLYVKEIKIGEASFFGVVVLDDAWDENIDGIVGFNLYKDCLATFDYPQQQLQFEYGQLPAADRKEVFDYYLDKRLPHINLMSNNDTIKVLVDTGMGGHLDINTSDERKFQYVQGKETRVKSKSFYFEGDVVKRMLQDPLKIGQYKIINSPIVISPEEGNRMGSGIFQYFSLTFDQKNQRLRFSSKSKMIEIR
jgi:predicted aspartyl protease